MKIGIDTLLREGATFAESTPARTERLKRLGFLAALSLGGNALFGFALGSFVGLDVAGLDALKLMGVTAFSFALCFPTLYVFATICGGTMGVAQITSLALTCTATVGCLLAALAPVMWLFAVSTEAMAFVLLFALALTTVALFFARRPLSGAEERKLIGSTTGFTAWLIIFVVVAFQTITLVRPMLSRPNASPEPQGKRFFVTHFLTAVCS